MKILRTPEHYFANLPEYPFEPHYRNVHPEGLRMHFVDEGPAHADPILMLHGEPSWSYLYRRMIQTCSQAGHRVIAPDLIGFGKSDKPGDLSDYSYERHVEWVTHLIEQLDLQNITLVCQDWGSLIGLRVAAEQEHRFARIVLANGGLPTGDHPMNRVFYLWQAFAKWTPYLPVGWIVAAGCNRKLSPQERKAYDAPFPSEMYKAGARAFPNLVPTNANDPAASANRSAWEVLKQWDKPFLTVFSNKDPITKGGERLFQKHVPGAQNQDHRIISGGHFLQEDSSIEFSQVIHEFIIKNQIHEQTSQVA